MCRAIAGLIRPTKTVVTLQNAAHEAQFSKTVSECNMDKSPWIKINKGDRLPQGRVLVVYEWEQQEIINGEKKEYLEIVYFGFTGAYWNAKSQHWIADHGKPIRNVTQWMPLPKAPWEYK